MAKTIVNLTFRLDVNGKLFRNKDTNEDIQETLLFNQLMTRFYINKGDLPLFPNLGLKQFFGRFGFLDEAEANMVVADLEAEIELQMGRNCTVSKVIDHQHKHIDISIELEGIKQPLSIRYFNNNGSIRIIEPQFND